MAAVGCFMSHQKCWRWILDHSETNVALILEDDCCLTGPQQNKLRRYVSELADMSQTFDFIAVGYHVSWLWWEAFEVFRDQSWRNTIHLVNNKHRVLVRPRRSHRVILCRSV